MTHDQDDDTPRDADHLDRELDQQFDLALQRDGPEDGVFPVWDGPHQFLGGVAGRAAPAHGEFTGSLGTTEVERARRAWSAASRRRAIARLLRQAPTLFEPDAPPFTPAWLAAVPPVVREFLDGNPVLDIDAVAFDLLRRATGDGRASARATPRLAAHPRQPMDGFLKS